MILVSSFLRTIGVALTGMPKIGTYLLDAQTLLRFCIYHIGRSYLNIVVNQACPNLYNEHPKIPSGLRGWCLRGHSCVLATSGLTSVAGDDTTGAYVGVPPLLNQTTTI
jgi:hypothetical protein